MRLLTQKSLELEFQKQKLLMVSVRVQGVQSSVPRQYDISYTPQEDESPDTAC